MQPKEQRKLGVRKTFGANKRQLVQQFLGESFILTFFALILAVILVNLSLPYLNTILDKNLTTQFLSGFEMPLLLVGILFVIGLLSGAYPAIFLSSIKTISVLKGLNLKLGNGTNSFRKSLVVIQFLISCALIILTIVIQQQIHFMRNKNLGFQSEQVLNVPLLDTEKQINYEPLKDKWLQIPGVKHITASSGIPTVDAGLHDFFIKPQLAAFDSLEMMTLTIDPDFSEVYGLEFALGRDFSDDFSTDAQEAVILNESAVKKLGWDDPIGKSVQVDYYYQGEQKKMAKVIGVVKDFNYHSLHKPIVPILLHMIPKSYYHDYLSLKLETNNLDQTLAGLHKDWQEFNPARPFEYSFLDDAFATLYTEETRLNRIFLFFTIIAIVIAGLGLFALSSFECAQRTKEIGIRKVMGASTSSILVLLAREFGRLILISFIIALPISWYTAQKWLNNFAYHINLNLGIFFAYRHFDNDNCLDDN